MLDVWRFSFVRLTTRVRLPSTRTYPLHELPSPAKDAKRRPVWVPSVPPLEDTILNLSSERFFQGSVDFSRVASDRVG